MGTSRRQRVRRRPAGSEVLEAAMVFPILLALAFGTVEFGYYFYTEHNLSCAAREGARAAVLPGLPDPDASAQTAVDRVMQAAGYTSSQYNIVFNSGDGYFTCKVEMHWSDVNAGLRPLQLISPKNDLVEGMATMRLESYDLPSE